MTNRIPVCVVLESETICLNVSKLFKPKINKTGFDFGIMKLTLVWLKLGGIREPEAFLVLARRPLVTGDIIASVGLLYLRKGTFFFTNLCFFTKFYGSNRLFHLTELPLWVLESYRDS